MEKDIYHFSSRAKALRKFAEGMDDIKNEPMFFNSDLDFAWSKGGDITRSFIEALPAEWLYNPIVFDSRVHMLMPGWYPAIPGYHHDDVPRPKIPVGQHFATAGQPDYDAPRYLSEHICGLVNAHVAPTNFALGDCSMPAVSEGPIYRTWHKEVERLLEAGELENFTAPDRTLINFDWQTFHTGTQAVTSGWRWFGRVTRQSDRCLEVSNEIRVNAQVYLEFPMEGW